VRRVVPEEVEACLADGDGLGMGQELGELVDSCGLVAACLVRMNPERGEDALLAFRDLERRRAGVDPGADSDNAVHAGVAGAGYQDVWRLLAHVEVRVRVDHAALAAACIRCSSSSTIDGSSLR
jgi:hypothetical protein